MFATGVSFPGSESLDIDPLRTQFAAGNIAMYISISMRSRAYMPASSRRMQTGTALSSPR